MPLLVAKVAQKPPQGIYGGSATLLQRPRQAPQKKTTKKDEIQGTR
jgi:hypothetical protein